MNNVYNCLLVAFFALLALDVRGAVWCRDVSQYSNAINQGCSFVNSDNAHVYYFCFAPDQGSLSATVSGFKNTVNNYGLSGCVESGKAQFNWAESSADSNYYTQDVKCPADNRFIDASSRSDRYYAPAYKIINRLGKLIGYGGKDNTIALCGGGWNSCKMNSRPCNAGCCRSGLR